MSPRDSDSASDAPVGRIYRYTVRDCVGSAGRQLPVGASDGRGIGRQGSDGSEPAAPRGTGELAAGDAVCRVGQAPWYAMYGRVGAWCRVFSSFTTGSSS